MVLMINGLTLALGEGEQRLPSRVAALLNLPEEALDEVRIVRRSIDARRARPPRFVYQVRVCLRQGAPPPAVRSEAGLTVTPLGDLPDQAQEQEGPSGPCRTPALRPVVVGCGPAGLFAALTLALRGIPVLLLERGKAVSERMSDVHAFWKKGTLDPESHVHFGEGGAGTFSDGKLTSRSKNLRTGWVKRVLVDMGAPSDILFDVRPHIGTDRLMEVVVRLRKRLVEMGCEVRFGARMTDLIVDRGGLVGVVVNDTEEIPSDRLILAAGQSADDAYRMLLARGVALAGKPFAIGLRVEHPQEWINRIQYGRWTGHPELPPADYFLTAKIEETGRSVYSFCMCPGGLVIGCSAREGGVITNGMSRCRRDSPYANSAVVVNVRVEDFGGQGPLAGLDFRRLWEERAFQAGGGDYRAPAQSLTGFLSGRSVAIRDRGSFLPGIREADLREVLPLFVGEALRRGFEAFERKMPGFITEKATLIGVETRTSSPVRTLRGEDGQSVTLKGLFPCGEGAGYAGGIISSALDGIRAAERLADSLA
jgi:uncharacterized FAD-dependent dehydrogenase